MKEETRTVNQLYDESERASLVQILNHFNGVSAEKINTRQDAKLAMGVVSAINRKRATESAGDHTQLEVIKTIARDRSEAREYVAVSLPHLNPAVKRLQSIVKKK